MAIHIASVRSVYYAISHRKFTYTLTSWSGLEVLNSPLTRFQTHFQTHCRLMSNTGLNVLHLHNTSAYASSSQQARMKIYKCLTWALRGSLVIGSASIHVHPGEQSHRLRMHSASWSFDLNQFLLLSLTLNTLISCEIQVHHLTTSVSIATIPSC